MDYETIIGVKRNNVAIITLNRPTKLNAINETMGEELVDFLNCCEESPDVKAVILTGSGRAFCSGGDLVSAQGLADSPLLSLKKLLNSVHPVVSELRRTHIPIIAAVNGMAVGGGFTIALACDLIIAAMSAKFNSQYVLIGASPDGGLSYMLPRLVGIKRAAWLMFTGEVVDAKTGFEMGFVNKVVADTELLNEAYALAQRLAAGSHSAIAQTKELLNLGLNESLETQMENEKQAIARIARTADFKEALRPFLDKQKGKKQK